MTYRLKAGLLSAVATLALVSCATPAQVQNLQPAAENPIAIADRAGPKLTALVRGINDAEAERDLDIAALDIAVNVRGGLAETTLTATFANPTKTDELEGRFVLNMPRGAVINGYALDINGQMIDGVLETRYAAAEAYQKRVNRRVDPGLVEVDYSDRFETRIFPIPAGGQRTIRLVMVSQFDPASGYSLPLTVGGQVGKFTMKVSGDAKVKGVPSGLGIHPVNEASNIALKGDLRLETTSSTAMLVSQHPGADAFFDISGALPRGAIDRHTPLHILWDRSLSRIDDNLKDEAQLAEDLALKRGLRRATITLFDSGKVETKEVAADRISETLDDVRYRGATSYATLQTLAIAPGADCLMFSDGRVTIDDRKDFLPACAVTAITSGPERDDAWLGDLAQRTGGAMHVLTKANAETVFGLLDKPDAAILAVTDGQGKAIETAPLASDRRNFHIVGPVPADGVVLVKVEGETAPRRFDLRTTVSVPFAGPGALWARHRLGVVAAETNPDELAALARRYNVATPQASFIVLETPADYVEAKINPPLSYPRELRAAYADLREAADAAASEHGQRDRSDRPDLRHRSAQEQRARARGLLGAVVRPLPRRRPDGRLHRPGVRGQGEGGEGEHRRVRRDRHEVRRHLDPDAHGVQGRRDGGARGGQPRQGRPDHARHQAHLAEPPPFDCGPRPDRVAGRCHITPRIARSRSSRITRGRRSTTSLATMPGPPISGPRGRRHGHAGAQPLPLPHAPRRPARGARRSRRPARRRCRPWPARGLPSNSPTRGRRPRRSRWGRP